MCFSPCLTSCYGGGCGTSGGGCGFCSECVATAACNPTLCSTCLTGANCASLETPTPGTGTDICTPSPAGGCAPIDVSACLPFAGTDANGNDIYQQPDGSLVYTDGTPATRADIAYNCGACAGTPCSPTTAGNATPFLNAGGKCSGPKGGGSGAGSSGGGGSKGSGGQCASKLSQMMNRFGSALTSLLSGGTKVPQKNVLPGQTVVKPATALSSNTFLLVLIVAGILLLFLAFGHKPVGD